MRNPLILSYSKSLFLYIKQMEQSQIYSISYLDIDDKNVLTIIKTAKGEENEKV